MERRDESQAARGSTGRPRRRQAERSAETRARILAAVVACVDEEGFAKTTSQRIAGRAGVSVGAVQHHFDSKAAILEAVLEDSAQRLGDAFEGVSGEGLSLEARVALFVDRAWRRYGSQEFGATLEILLNARDALEHSQALLGASARRASTVWNRFFSDLEISKARQREILRYALAGLLGLAVTQRVQRDAGGGRRGEAAQRALLERALCSLLREEAHGDSEAAGR